MVLEVRVKREGEQDNNLELPFRNVQQVQNLLQVLSEADVQDLVVEIRFGSKAETPNGKLDEDHELKAIQKSAKYTYG